MTEDPSDIRARRIAEAKRDMREELEATIEQRVQRYLEIGYQGVVAGNHFAPASGECIRLYRDGYFLSAVMVSQAVTEALWRFVLERNGIKDERGRSDVAPELVQQRILSQDAAEAFVRIGRSFRNDVHHLSPKVSTIPFAELARRNLIDLARIEGELFNVTFDNGRMVPGQPKYWDLRGDGRTTVFLRDMWIE